MHTLGLSFSDRVGQPHMYDVLCPIHFSSRHPLHPHRTRESAPARL